MQALAHPWVESRGGAVPRPLGPAVSRGAANVAALRRLRNMVGTLWPQTSVPWQSCHHLLPDTSRRRQIGRGIFDWTAMLSSASPQYRPYAAQLGTQRQCCHFHRAQVSWVRSVLTLSCCRQVHGTVSMRRVTDAALGSSRRAFVESRSRSQKGMERSMTYRRE